MTQENIAWSITDELKLIKGLKDNYSFAALSSVIGKDVEEIQRKCIAMDLYIAVCENIDDLSQITLVPNHQVGIACLGKTMTGIYRELTEMGWAPQVWRGGQSLRSPEWWASRPALAFRYNDDADEPTRRTIHLLNNGKPWTPEDVGILMAALSQRPSKDALTQVLMRSMSNVIQQLSIMGLVHVGTAEDSSEAKVWVCPAIQSRILSKMRYFDVLPLLQTGWLIDGMQLIAPTWWSEATQITDLVPSSWPLKISAATDTSTPVSNNEHMLAAANLLKSVNAKRQAIATTDPQPAPKTDKLTEPEALNPSSSDEKRQSSSPREKGRNGKLWFSGNYKFLFTLLGEHHSPDVIAKKMDRTAGAVCSRIQLIGLTRYVKSDVEGEKGKVCIVREVSIDTLRKQPDFVKDHLIGAGWTEKGNFLISPDWWLKYPHTLG
ncbi:hypothetical protein J0A78_02020 [Providencia rettgeri]|uniref:Uncharacterized protein n=2 Tax=Morganellaceae TaxID=1903414 RepID=A0A1B8HMB4_9GAMM|nr:MULTISPECIES: hypothetical protein [Morganellaceae]MBN7840626.1 hypothetical protein [Providencia rettgeri]MBN7854895.1 hypothetical protein [Providencia rettgeri]MBN7860655.1 hypothetical protein [Providencia rettgeri]MBN7870793.1 hypothetical protein [Providencia rettgeri]MBN7896160.1 hypothetical protein [Providencia rettgeri]